MKIIGGNCIEALKIKYLVTWSRIVCQNKVLILQILKTRAKYDVDDDDDDDVGGCFWCQGHAYNYKTLCLSLNDED